ncbi:hypothetical protein [Noviherbaspirillum massiliense]|uniref:hypothetical protein n=1 Tax=Noviherbaspirillum massiliense TaxID=1465823 RepID=UPI0003168F60|nr:hypothetical protein [Noviherbaspirillum massiliense]
MKIKREDLVDAAGAGLLQYRQIDPLLIFLLQRDVAARRRALHEQVPAEPAEKGQVLLSLLGGMLGIAAAALFALLVTVPAVRMFGLGSLLTLTLLYAFCAFRLTAWFRERGTGLSIRILSGSGIALMPLAIFALEQAR